MYHAVCRSPYGQAQIYVKRTSCSPIPVLMGTASIARPLPMACIPAFMSLIAAILIHSAHATDKARTPKTIIFDVYLSPLVVDKAVESVYVCIRVCCFHRRTLWRM